MKSIIKMGHFLEESEPWLYILDKTETGTVLGQLSK